MFDRLTLAILAGYQLTLYQNPETGSQIVAQLDLFSLSRRSKDQPELGIGYGATVEQAIDFALDALDPSFGQEDTNGPS